MQVEIVLLTLELIVCGYKSPCIFSSMLLTKDFNPDYTTAKYYQKINVKIRLICGQWMKNDQKMVSRIFAVWSSIKFLGFKTFVYTFIKVDYKYGS